MHTSPSQHSPAPQLPVQSTLAGVQPSGAPPRCWPSGHSARRVQGSVPFPKVEEKPPVHRSEDRGPGRLSQLPGPDCSTPLPPPPSLISGINPDPVPPRDRLLPPPTGTRSSEPVEAPATGGWSHSPTASLAVPASEPCPFPPSKSEERGQGRGRQRGGQLQTSCLPHLGTACPGRRNQSTTPKVEAVRIPEPEPTRGPAGKVPDVQRGSPSPLPGQHLPIPTSPLCRLDSHVLGAPWSPVL